ncbi:MAG: MupG family TIM beta-alpha barrel fold protein [Erysipelotrichaceae bacterium]|nr:MupG family TIM beta-alpha barrel fold protein [Erysipelotrichaceae bacterium]
MNKAISIYPHELSEDYLLKCETYLKLANTYGFNTLFTSIHLPEIDIHKQIDTLVFLNSLALNYNYELIVDVAGNSLKTILDDKKLFDKVSNIKPFILRLDCNYDLTTVILFTNKIKIKGFMINASTFNEVDATKEVEQLRCTNSNVIACHNFYPRKETGLDEEFIYKQENIFNKLNVEIYYCLPSIQNLRGPLHEGLPTIESHRNKDIYYCALELINKYHVTNILFSDEFYLEDEFKAFKDVEDNKIIPIKVRLLSNKYEDIVLQKQKFRYDSNSNYLRSLSSRKMAEFSTKIEKDNCVERTKGSITIDNELYLRYSGELQVVLKDNPKDDRVNVVGYIEEDELLKLEYYRQGYEYLFVRS